MGSLGKVRLTGWLTMCQLVVWTAFAASALAYYCLAVWHTSTEGPGGGRAGSEAGLIVLFPPLLISALPALIWWWALASWRRRKVNAGTRIWTAAILTALVPVVIALVPRWLLPHWYYVVGAFGLIGVLALAAAWGTLTREVRAQLTEPTKRQLRRASIPPLSGAGAP